MRPFELEAQQPFDEALRLAAFDPMALHGLVDLVEGGDEPATDVPQHVVGVALEHRREALQLLASKMTVPKDQVLTAELLTQLGDQLNKVSPEQLLKYAQNYPAGTEGVPADVTKFVDNLKSMARSRHSSI